MDSERTRTLVAAVQAWPAARRRAANLRVLEGSGLMGRMLQHETDHLDGVLFLDRMSSLTSLTLASTEAGARQS